MTDGPATYRAILVTQATGTQGRAASEHLLARGYRVRALTRDARIPAARAARGVELVEGDPGERSALERALSGCAGVFAVQTPGTVGIQEEIRQGMLLADVARDVGVRQFVYSSIGSADRGTGLPRFESKWRIEEHVRTVGVPHMILRPAYFMENWEPLRAMAADDVLPHPLGPETRLQQVAASDVGALAAQAFADPQAWLGRAVEIAGDELTMREAAVTFSHVLGREVEYRRVPRRKRARRASARANRGSAPDA